MIPLVQLWLLSLVSVASAQLKDSQLLPQLSLHGSAEQRIETTTPLVFSNHNVNLNNVGLADEKHLDELGPKLQGPNVCTKQEA